MKIEGYAALFGVADLSGDIVRMGAFRHSLAQRVGPLPMLVQHEHKALAGHWLHVREDARGLFVQGEIDERQPGAARALRLIARGTDGLSIGFIARVAYQGGRGRVLEDIDLLEVSLVTLPMQPLARLSRVQERLRA
jgi:HK97 family phage prohead protease